MTAPTVYLASRSARRRELLALARIVFDLLDLEIDESPHPGEQARGYVSRMADEKCAAGWAIVAAQGKLRRPVLAADTAVVLDGRILGKPADAADAHAMLRSLAGRRHEVLTAVTVIHEQRMERLCSCSAVQFGSMAEADIRRYVDSGEPMDKAGAYAVQGGAQQFIERVEGSVSGIMGLPLYETLALLGRFGVAAR